MAEKQEGAMKREEPKMEGNLYPFWLPLTLAS